MRIHVEDGKGETVRGYGAVIKLSERNLLALLLQFQRHQLGLLVQNNSGECQQWRVIVEPDDQHYGYGMLPDILTTTDDEIEALRQRLHGLGGDVCGG